MHRPPSTGGRDVFTLANLREVPTQGTGGQDLLAGSGLGRPAARVALYTDRPEPVERLTFGAARSEHGAIAVRRESTRQVYHVSDFILDELRRPAMPPPTSGSAGPRSEVSAVSKEQRSAMSNERP